MPSAAPPPQQLGVLRRERAPTQGPERSILGIPNPEWSYCSPTAATERAKPRLCPSPKPISRARTASLRPRSKGTLDKLSSEMAFFPQGTQGSKLVVRGSLNHLQTISKSSLSLFAKDRQSTSPSHPPPNYRRGSTAAILVELLFPNWQSRYVCDSSQDSQIASPAASSLSSINASRRS